MIQVHCYVIDCPRPGRPENWKDHFSQAGLSPRYIQGIHGKTWGLTTRFWNHQAQPGKSLAHAVEGCRQVIRLAEAGEPPLEILAGLVHRVLPDCLHDEKTQGVQYKIDPGHIGLCLSHWMLWQMAWDRGCDEVLICEDDCIFCPGFEGLFHQYRAELPAEWDCWYVGSLHAHRSAKTMITDHLCALHSGFPWGTHCILVNRKALPVLMEKCQRAYTHIDSLIAEKALPHLNWYCSYPNLVEQHSASGSWKHSVGGGE